MFRMGSVMVKRKRALIGGLAALLLAGCGNMDPEPATYRGRLTQSNDFDLRGDVVFTIAQNGDVLGTLKGEVSPQNRTYEWRGELNHTSYTGTLKASGDTQYDVTGTIYQASGTLNLTLNISRDGTTNSVSFSMDQL